MDTDGVPWNDLVEERLAFLERLSESAAEKPDLERDLDCSRSTIDRAIRRLNSAELIERTSDGYVTTPLGRVAADRYRSYVAEQRTVADAQRMLSVLPPDSEVPSELVVGGTVASAGQRPTQLFNSLARHLRTAAEYRVALPELGDSRHLRLLHARVISDDLDATLLLSPTLEERLREEFPTLLGELCTAESCTIRRAEVPPFAVAVSRDGSEEDTTATTTPEDQGTALLVTYDDGTLAGTIENESTAAVMSARRLLTSLESEGTPIVKPTAQENPGTSLIAEERQIQRALDNAGMARLDHDTLTEQTPSDPERAWRLGFDFVDIYYGYAVERVDPSLAGDATPGSTVPAQDGGQLQDGSHGLTDSDTPIPFEEEDSLPAPPDVAVAEGSEGSHEPDNGSEGTPTSPRPNSNAPRVSAVLADRLSAGDDYVVMGPPGSGKSTICRLVACRWIEESQGPVFYRRADATGTDLAGLQSLVTAAAGHALVVVEDATGRLTEPTLEFVQTIHEKSGVSVLIESPNGAWQSAIDEITDPRLRDLARKELQTYCPPSVEERTCRQAVTAFEAATGREVPLSPAALYDRVQSADGVGEMYVLSQQLVNHTLSPPWLDEATAPSALEGDVRALYDRLTRTDAEAEASLETIPIEVGVLVATLTAAEWPVTPGLVHAVGAARGEEDRSDRAHRHVEAAVEELDGRMLLREEESPTYRTQHPRWAVQFLEHAVDRAERETVAIFERAVNAIFALADDPTRREQIENWLGSDSPSVRRIRETETADEFIESLFRLAFSRSGLAPLFGTTEHSGLAFPDACSVAAELEAISCRGKMWYDHGDPDRGEAELATLCTRATAAADPETRATYLAEAFRGLGEVIVDRGETEIARELLERSLSAARNGAPNRHEVGALNSLAWVAMTEEDYDRAQEHLNTAQAIAEDIGASGDYADTLYYLARLSRSQGDLASAEEYLSETVTMDREIGNRQNISSSLKLLGDIATERGATDRAKRYYRRSIELKHEVGDRQGLAQVLYEYGDLARSAGDSSTAREALERSLELAQENSMRRHEGRVLGGLGRLALECDKLETAAERFRDQRRIHEELDYRRGVGEANAGLGDIAIERGAIEQAREYYRDSVSEYRTVGDPRATVERIEQLIDLCRSVDDETAAHRWEETAIELCQEAELPELLDKFGDTRTSAEPDD